MASHPIMLLLLHEPALCLPVLMNAILFRNIEADRSTAPALTMPHNSLKRFNYFTICLPFLSAIVEQSASAQVFLAPNHFKALQLFRTIYKWIQRQFRAIGAYLRLCNLFPHPQIPSMYILNTNRNGRLHLRQLASKEKHENTQRRIGMPRDRRSQGCMRTVP
jgi:hypothetical protein